MKNKGQALVEFIIILPILMLLILGTIDFGNILYQKYTLENDLDHVIELVKQNKTLEINSYLNPKNITVSIDTKTDTIKVTLTKKIKITTPGLNKILSSPYTIETNRVIVNE